MWQGFTGWHALIILVVILLLFGAPKLPALARSLGQSMKILKSEVRPEKDGAATDAEAADGTTSSTTATSTPATSDVAGGQAKTDEADTGKSR
ncbi:Sec-independent protein translocase subunit TatA [Agromyces mariniharenae]|uniref:Sec-independent protein translocase protein TatA n=1 Tax=Agromyces mariniharenae TaxID=2604423 RepID=A0A5S4VA07_9MICO|nr:Sec-independent protein translocase subunit TatA [Agromyces mariniharenae]NUT59235.1 Sec-independent protein translocase subunit TatA [Agromyces sp.]TYL50905.1 twin-arginine translocase TatA/TatE family subunit [Agromyces mariniharenae]HEU0182587.1 Sec-independent protein translocase subunit TatA [Agromyces mariniharenae]